MKTCNRTFMFFMGCLAMIVLPGWPGTALSGQSTHDEGFSLTGCNLEAGMESSSEFGERLVLAQVGVSQEPGTETGVLPQDEEPVEPISDPLEPVNRVFFEFNDRLYFWLLKPVATGYKTVIPEPLRVAIRNAFSNVMTPVRAVNCLLQGDFKGVGTELARLVINSTMGVLGMGDAGKEVFDIAKRNEDFGQTLGVYGLGPAFYINWPVLGPSSVRDTFGFAGDFFLDPVYYLVPEWGDRVGIRAGERVNHTSLTIGDYESLKKAALDPYVALRDAYNQYRENKIKERGH